MTSNDKYKNLLEEVVNKEILLIQNISKLENKKLNSKTVFKYISSIVLVTTISMFLFASSSVSLALLLPLLYSVTVPSYKTITKYCKLKKLKSDLVGCRIEEKNLRANLNTMPKFNEDKIYDYENEKNKEKNYTLQTLQLENLDKNIESKPYVYVKRK